MPVNKADKAGGTAERLRPVLLRLARELRREVQSSELAGHELSLLALVDRNPGIGVSKLAELERVSKPAISGKVDRLVELGLVQRAEAGDRRCVHLQLTSAGRKVLRDVRKRRNAWLDVRLAQLTPSSRRAIDAATGPLLELLEVAS
jgi:DNA-binding MarR family transcriptional regulator